MVYLKQGARNANLIVEIALSGNGIHGFLQNCIHHIFGGSFTIAARYGYFFSTKTPLPTPCQLQQCGSAIIHWNISTQR